MRWECSTTSAPWPAPAFASDAVCLNAPGSLSLRKPVALTWATRPKTSVASSPENSKPSCGPLVVHCGQGDAGISGSLLSAGKTFFAVAGASSRAVLDPAEHGGKSPAVAFAAALLGAGAVKVFPQQLQNGTPGWYIAGISHFAAPEEANIFDGRLHSKGVRGHENQVAAIGPCITRSASCHSPGQTSGRRLAWCRACFKRCRHPARTGKCRAPGCTFLRFMRAQKHR